MSELVERLRAFRVWDCELGLCVEAAEEIERLEAQIVSLREAVRGLLPHVFTWQTGDPSEYPMLVEFWESEQKLGRGEAAAVLAAYATLSSTGEG